MFVWFQGLAIVFDKFMGERLGKAYTPLAKASWMKALTVVNAVIEKGMEEVKQSDKQETEGQKQQAAQK